MRLGYAMALPVRLGAVERLAYVGVLVSLVALVLVSVLGRSGLGTLDFATNVTALAAVIVGGVLVTVSPMIARRFSDRGVGSDAVLGMRFLLAAILAIAGELAFGQPSLRPELDAIPWIVGAVFALIVIPRLFSAAGHHPVVAARGQRHALPRPDLRVRRHSSWTAGSASPGATLACILAFAVCTLVSRFARGGAEIRQRS